MDKYVMTEIGKRNKKIGHQRLETSIDNARKSLEDAIENREYYHQLLDLIPKELWAYGGYWGGGSFYPTVPWDWPLVTRIVKKLEALGWEKSNEYSDNDGKDLHLCFYRSNEEQKKSGKTFGVYITVSANHSESKCVLVPLRVETKQVVTAYDHICPDSHPELFKFGQDGQWEYVGDELFPAIKIEED